VHVASSNGLLARRGRPATRPADTPVASDARAGLTSDPDGYFCAIEEGQIRGMVSALVRGRVWYLSMFFVLPSHRLNDGISTRLPATDMRAAIDVEDVASDRRGVGQIHDCVRDVLDRRGPTHR
jgi:hypothetical protein